MKAWAITGLLFCGLASAHPGTYKGKGQFRNPGSADTNYDSQLVVKELAKDKYEVTETFTPAGGKSIEFKSTFEFDKNGTIKISQNGVVVGHGYTVPTGTENHWCDYKRQTEKGTVHINMYYDAENKVMYRMGDMVELAGVKTFNEKLQLE